MPGSEICYHTHCLHYLGTYFTLQCLRNHNAKATVLIATVLWGFSKDEMYISCKHMVASEEELGG